MTHPTDTTLNITTARREGLHVLAHRGRGLQANETDINRGIINHQVARYLHDTGLVEHDPAVDPTQACWVLTDLGRQVATELGLELKAAE